MSVNFSVYCLSLDQPALPSQPLPLTSQANHGQNFTVHLEIRQLKQPSSMSGGRPPTNTFRENISANCAWAAWEPGESCDGDMLGTVWSSELLLFTMYTSPNAPKGDFSANNWTHLQILILQQIFWQLTVMTAITGQSIPLTRLY